METEFMKLPIPCFRQNLLTYIIFIHGNDWVQFAFFVFKLFTGSVFKGGMWYTGETFHSPLVEKYDKEYNL